jgi:predicted pyridoxine 5'-phosphate oxidase superfamily flavin-nucleotide-binding protein
MIQLDDQMADAVNSAVADGTPCLIGTASASGMPNISYRGSVMVLDRERLAFWERAKGGSLSNLEENPQIEVFYRNRDRGLAWRFYGRATIHESGDLREQVMNRVIEAELRQDPERQGIAVVIEVDRVANGRGETLQTRE